MCRHDEKNLIVIGLVHVPCQQRGPRLLRSACSTSLSRGHFPGTKWERTRLKPRTGCELDRFCSIFCIKTHTCTKAHLRAGKRSSCSSSSSKDDILQLVVKTGSLRAGKECVQFRNARKSQTICLQRRTSIHISGLRDLWTKQGSVPVPGRARYCFSLAKDVTRMNTLLSVSPSSL